MADKKYIIYTDGSYSDVDGLAHGGIVYINENNECYNEIHIYSERPEFTSMRNVGGEVLAAWAGITSIQNGVKELPPDTTIDIELYYDYEGVGKWITGEWQAKKVATAWYKKSVNELLGLIPKHSFYPVWVKGHDGDYYNSIADKVASWDISYCLDNNISRVCVDGLLKQYGWN